jgi:hypothetical protein
MRYALILACVALPLQGCVAPLIPLAVGAGGIGGYAAAPRDAEGRKCYGFLGCYETAESFTKAIRERDRAAAPTPLPPPTPARTATRREVRT